MKIVGIWVVWHDWDLLEASVRNLRPLLDGVIIIASTRSNYNEYSPIPEYWKTDELFVREPKFHIPMHSETDKRNYGLEIAKRQGYTHFIMMDADEFYIQDEFEHAKRIVKAGLVCPVVVYFGSPELTLGRDVTLVPHIHKLTPQLRHEFNRGYPHAWKGGQIRIDPTRSLNINSGVDYCDEVEMHHLSWVRKDINVKIRNSTARKNLERSTIVKDFLHAKEGYYVDFYRKHLTRCPDRFGINDKERILRQGF